MHAGDRRHWLATDRPGERVALSTPLPAVRLTSVQNSNRCWSEYHLEFSLILVSSSSKGLSASYSSKGVSASYRCRGSHSAGAGQLMAFEPGDHHVITRISGGRAHFDVITIEASELERVASELDHRGPFHFRTPHITDVEMAQALEGLVRSVAAGAGNLEVECQYTSFLLKVFRGCSESRPSFRRLDAIRHGGIRATRNYLRDSCRDNPSLAELAQRAGLSRFAFAHAFKKHVGLSPHAYLKLRRVSEARRLLERGMPIADVARSLGYVDVPFLTRTFKAYFGAPPARWRRHLERNQ